MQPQLIGAILIAIALVLIFGNHTPLGHLPGDITIQGKHGTLYAPITTCLILSIILSIIFGLLKGNG